MDTGAVVRRHDHYCDSVVDVPPGRIDGDVYVKCDLEPGHKGDHRGTWYCDRMERTIRWPNTEVGDGHG